MKLKLIVVFLIGALISFNKLKNYLFLKTNSHEEYAYVNFEGKTIIPFGKYLHCFTDTFKNYAIVEKRGAGLVIIDRREKVIYKVFIFDNGPDILQTDFLKL